MKINPDWLHLEPMTMWLGNRTDFPLIGSLFTETWVVAVASYGSILLHVVGAPLLLFRRTRMAVFILYVVFHSFNHMLFNIGIFPWLTIAGTTIFFAPDWPRRVLAVTARIIPFADRTRGDDLFGNGADRMPAARTRARGQRSRYLVMGLAGLWMASQILIPLRHHLYPGDTSWTEQGHRFAWQMKLRDKRSTALFLVRDPETGRNWEVNNLQFLTRRQNIKMASRPDMILQFAHHLAGIWRTHQGVENPEVRAIVWSSLNGRERELLVDPSRDLAAIKRDLYPAD